MSVNTYTMCDVQLTGDNAVIRHSDCDYSSSMTDKSVLHQ